MIPRQLTASLKRVATHFPVVALTGPRQSGKTTLARALFAHKPYVSLENPAELAFARHDPGGFLARFRDGAVFDQAQRWPELFSWLQGLVDEDRRPGRFVLTGSQQFGLMAGISQSLAGRVAVTQLLPLALAECAAAGRWPADVDSMLLAGGYPALRAGGYPALLAGGHPALLAGGHAAPRAGGHAALRAGALGSRRLAPAAAADWFASYVATYVERDVRQLLGVQNLVTFQRFVRLCAARTGQLLNLASLAGETGISEGSARAWLSVLENSYLVHRLPPYHRNFGKRLTKSPKLYFLDTGLACWLLGIHDEALLSLHPMRAALFETWVVGEFIKHRFNAGGASDLYFWRDNNGLEADLVFEHGGRLQAIEIKSGRTVTEDYLRAAQRAGRIGAGEAWPPWLIHGGDAEHGQLGVRVIGWRALARA